MWRLGLRGGDDGHRGGEAVDELVQRGRPFRSNQAELEKERAGDRIDVLRLFAGGNDRVPPGGDVVVRWRQPRDVRAVDGWLFDASQQHWRVRVGSDRHRDHRFDAHWNDEFRGADAAGQREMEKVLENQRGAVHGGGFACGHSVDDGFAFKRVPAFALGRLQARGVRLGVGAFDKRVLVDGLRRVAAVRDWLDDRADAVWRRGRFDGGRHQAEPGVFDAALRQRPYAGDGVEQAPGACVVL